MVEKRTMWILFDMVHPRIMHTSPEVDQLRFEEGELPQHLATIRVSRIESIEDPAFLGSPKDWSEMNLRRLYTWMKLTPALSPGKMDAAALLNLRLRIRAEIANGLAIEPAGLPTLVGAAPAVSAPAAPPAPRLPPAPRGSVGPLIHRVATEMWEAAGRPKDPGVILQLRRRIMTTLLDDHKIKTATSSNELGRWQKQTLAG